MLRGQYRSLGHVVIAPEEQAETRTSVKTQFTHSRFYDEASIRIHAVVNRQLSVEG